MKGRQGILDLVVTPVLTPFCPNASNPPRYDSDRDGRLSRYEFEHLLNEYLQNKAPSAAPKPPTPPSLTSGGGAAPPPLPAASAPPAPRGAKEALQERQHSFNHLSNMNLTHYNETTGVPLPPDAVYRYTSVYGHVVVPLAEAFEKRMHKLQVCGQIPSSNNLRASVWC